MGKLFLYIILFFFLKSNTSFAQLEERNVSVGLKENKLTAGQALSMIINPRRTLSIPVFLQIAIVDQSLSVVHQQTLLFNQATEYKWALPAELKKGLYIATVSVDHNEGTEMVGLPFSYIRTDLKIPKINVLLPIQLDTVFYGFNLRFKTNINSVKPIYYNLQTKDSIKRTGFIQADSTGIVEIGGNNFYESGDIIFSMLDTCNGCKIELYNEVTNTLNSDYLNSLFKQADSTIVINNNKAIRTESEFKGNLPNVVVRTRVKTRKELYEAAYVNNYMLKSPMSREVVVDDDPFAVNYNNNLIMYLVKVFPGLSISGGGLMYRLGSVALLVDETPFTPAPDYLSDIAYIKFLPEPPRGLNIGQGFFSNTTRAIAGTTATVVIYTKKNF